MAGCSDGTIYQYSLKSYGKSIWSAKEEGNEIFVIDVSPDNTKLATAGRDREIRIYDEETKTEAVKMYEIDQNEPIHAK